LDHLLVSDDLEKVDKNCYQESGRGVELDNEISKLAELPKIYPNYKDKFDEYLTTIWDYIWKAAE
jgi:hypothetical protein